MKTGRDLKTKPPLRSDQLHTVHFHSIDDQTNQGMRVAKPSVASHLIPVDGVFNRVELGGSLVDRLPAKDEDAAVRRHGGGAVS